MKNFEMPEINVEVFNTSTVIMDDGWGGGDYETSRD